ncbi:MAG: hypothetical protein ACO1TE_03495 [Prosthecobacter sp.]
MNRLLLLALGLFVCTSQLRAQQPAASGDWSVQVYRYPAAELIGGFVSSEHGQLTPPKLPAPDAKEEDVVAFVRRSHFVVDQHLKSFGISLPAGSLAVFDPVNKTLALRSTRLAHERMFAQSAQAERNMPRHVHFNVQIIEAESASVQEAAKTIRAQADHSAAWKMLDTLVSQGRATHVGSLRLETKSGTRATVERGEQRLYFSEVAVDESKRSSTASEMRRVGTVFEVEPTIGADGETIDLTFSLEHHHGPALQHWNKINASGDRVVETPSIDFHPAHVTTSVTVLSGMTKFVGLWKPEGNPEAARAGRLQAAFLKTHIVTLLPALNPRAEQLLKQHGEKVEKTPTAPPPEPPGATKGIITRSFHITEDLLTMDDSAGSAYGAAAGAADPFAAAPAGAAPMVNESRMTMRVTALEILKSKGIPFPEGSSANYTPSTGELLVRNTVENMRLVEEFLVSRRRHAPRNVTVTLHVVEAPAATIRKLEEDTALVTDHTAAWSAIEQQAAQNNVKVLRTALIETKSGTRCTFTTGREFMHVSSAETSSVETKSDSNSAPASDAKAGGSTHVTQVQVATGTGASFSPYLEMQLVGLSLELEPVVGQDSSEIDLNYQLKYDYAEPEVDEVAPPEDAKLLRPLNASVQFHQTVLTTGTTIANGTSRLLGIWKPEGTAELDKADVLQAAFLTLDVVPVVREKKP